MGSRHITPQDYNHLATLRGFELIGNVPRTVNDKTLWRCAHNHEWVTTYHELRRGRGCPKCGKQSMADKARKNSSDYHALATANAIEWLGPEVERINHLTRWRCAKGHEFESRYNAIQQGHGCRFCMVDFLSDLKRHSPEDYHALASKRGFVWLGPDPLGSHNHTYWRADCGHEWAASYLAILHGNGCGYCSKTARKTAGDYADLARNRGLFWLGPMVEHTKIKTAWQCAKGHTFQAKYNSVHNRGSCPICQDTVNGNYISTQQVAIHAMLGGEMNRRVWRYSIDIALEVSGVNIAIEYDSAYWHEGRESEDKRRDDYLIAHGYRVLHIRSGHLLPTRAQLDAAIQELLNGATYAEIILDDWS